MTRLRAFAIHFCISLLIFLVLVAAILIWWYPGFFFHTDGGWQGVRIIALVDLILGPCLTLIVFRQGKPGLKWDLTLIGLFQAICLSAGTWVVYSERPVALVMVDEIFFSMSADDYLSAGVSPPDLSRFDGRGPKWVTVDLSKDVYESLEFRRRAFDSNQPLRTLHERYIPFEPAHLDISRAVSLKDLEILDENTGGLPKWLDEHGGKLEDYVFFQFGGRYSLIHLGFRKSDMTMAGLLSTPGPV